MNKSSQFIVIFSLILSLTACKTFTPKYSITEHHLIDKIWSVEQQQYISANTLRADVQKNDAILLGETHDNARHHQLQALVIDSLVNQQNQPAIAFEMLDQKQQESISQFQKDHESSNDKTDAFAQVIDWENSGWPKWPYYRPVFHSALSNDLPIIAANLDLKLIRQVIKQGDQVLDTDYQILLKKYQYDEPLQKELEQEILSAHCDMLPKKLLAPMLMGQQTRDLAITRAMQTALTTFAGEAVVLIAGSGHTRTDYGVPFYLEQEMPELKIISIAFMEVSKDKLKPEDYAQAWGVKSQTDQQIPFDYIWFTPRAEREDQCEKMKAYMKKKSS